jgi:hypothetical protein
VRHPGSDGHDVHMGIRGAPGTVEVPPSRLNPTDAALWDIERNPTLRTTIVAVLMLDRPVDPARLRDVIEVATRRIPRLRQRVVAHTAGVGTPHWELVADFDLDDHVRVVPASAGVDDAAVAAVAAPLASEPFRRDRPLWELVYLDPPAGRSAVILKVHHSLTDGVGGIGLLDVMLDRDRGAPHADPDTVPLPVPGRRPAPTDEERGKRVRRVVDLPWDAASAATTAVFHPVRTASGSWEAVRSAGRLLAPSAAPLSPLLTGRGMERSASMAHVDLVRLHDAAARHGCTINHAFFAAAIGGIGAYHRAMGSDLGSSVSRCPSASAVPRTSPRATNGHRCASSSRPTSPIRSTGCSRCGPWSCRRVARRRCRSAIVGRARPGAPVCVVGRCGRRDDARRRRHPHERSRPRGAALPRRGGSRTDPRLRTDRGCSAEHRARVAPRHGLCGHAERRGRRRRPRPARRVDRRGTRRGRRRRRACSGHQSAGRLLDAAGVGAAHRPAHGTRHRVPPPRDPGVTDAHRWRARRRRRAVARPVRSDPDRRHPRPRRGAAPGAATVPAAHRRGPARARASALGRRRAVRRRAARPCRRRSSTR